MITNFLKILNLKSNMDRFIAMSPNSFDNRFIDLKSNMDRFIDELMKQGVIIHADLKSNMDRFIGPKILFL